MAKTTTAVRERGRAIEGVGEQAAAVPLPTFLAAAGTLTLNQRKLLVDQAILLLEQNYVHLPLKVAMHAVNPVQRLRVLRTRMDRQTQQTMEPEWSFHRQMSGIFHSVRDLHTNYLLPAPFAGKIAFLPFAIEKCLEGGAERYLVTQTVVGFSAPPFGRGVEVTHWNGTPIARAVALNGAQFAGSNEAANLARGLDSLTLRPLVIQTPPDEEWVTVTYLAADGTTHELREQWKVIDNLPPMADLDTISVAATSMGLDLDSDEKSRAKKLLFTPEVVELERGLSSAMLDEPAAVGGCASSCCSSGTPTASTSCTRTSTSVDAGRRRRARQRPRPLGAVAAGGDGRDGHRAARRLRRHARRARARGVRRRPLQLVRAALAAALLGRRRGRVRDAAPLPRHRLPAARAVLPVHGRRDLRQPRRRRAERAPDRLARGAARATAALEDAMAVVRETVRLGLAARGQSKLKVRQPLRAAVVVAAGEERAAIERLADVALEELNVKELRYVSQADELGSYEVKPNYRALGPRFGKQMPQVAAAVAALDPEHVARARCATAAGSASASTATTTSSAPTT